MTLKTLISLAVAAAFATPVLAQQSGSTMQPKDSNPAAPPAAHGPSSTTTDKSATTAPARPASGSSAADRKPNTPKFSEMDKNNDGYISRDEARDAEWNSRFSELDKDNDNRLSQSEHNAMQAGTGASSAPLTGATGAPDRKPNTPKSETGKQK